MTTQEITSMVPDIFPPDRRAAELSRLAEIVRRLREEDPAELERRRIYRLSGRIVADYLAGYHPGLIQQKFSIGKKAMDEVVNAATTPEERQERKAYIHRLKARAWNRQNTARLTDRRMKQVGRSRSVMAARRRMVADSRE